MKRLGICILVCLASVASVLSSDVECPDGRWMVTLPHEDCHQFHLCLFGRAVEIKCPFGLYWDPIEGGCGRKVDVACMNVETRQDPPPQPPVQTTTFPPQPSAETTEGPTDETSPEEETSPGEETSPEDGTATPPFSTTGNTPTPPFSTTGGDTPTPPVMTTGDGQPTPPVSTTVDGSETGTPPEVTTGTGETTTGIQTGTPPESTTAESTDPTTPPITTTTTTTTTAQPPTTVPPLPTCPPTGIHYFPDPQSCNHFFLCQNGQIIHMMCAPGQIFDQTYLRCRHDGVCVLFGWLDQ